MITGFHWLFWLILACHLLECLDLRGKCKNLPKPVLLSMGSGFPFLFCNKSLDTSWDVSEPVQANGHTGPIIPLFGKMNVHTIHQIQTTTTNEKYARFLYCTYIYIYIYICIYIYTHTLQYGQSPPTNMNNFDRGETNPFIAQFWSSIQPAIIESIFQQNGC